MFRRIYKFQFISKIIRAYLFFSMILKNISFPLTVPRPTSIWETDFSLQSHLSFTAAYSLKSEKDWPVDFAKL